MPNESHFELRTSEGLPLRLDLRVPDDKEPQSCVVVIHGFKGFKDWGFFPYAARYLARAGLASISFDFSCNGIGERPGEFDRLDLFERNTYARELEDLDQVIRWLRDDSPLPKSCRGGGLGLLGHSRGALSAVVRAAEDPRVAAVVSWNGVANALHYTKRQLQEWREQGRLEFVNSRTQQRMAVGYSFVEEAMAHAARYDLAARAQEMNAAHLILHATQDLAVDPVAAEVLRAGRTEEGRCRLQRIEGAGHTWNVVHPFAGSTPQLEQVLALTTDWFREHLPEG